MYNKKKATDKPVGKSSGLNHSSSGKASEKHNFPKQNDSKKASDVCPVHKKCGGCQYQGMAYKKQLSLKQRQANMLLGKFGTVLPIIGMKDPLHYRNKVHAVFAFEKGKAIAQQIKDGKDFFAKKYPSMKYIAYFQAFTNTYGDIDTLKRRYEEALSQEDIVGLVIGTRPDAVDDATLNYLEQLNRQTFLIVEYGIESANDATLRRINRGHDFECSRRAISKTHGRGILTGGHIIIGLPGEDENESLRQAPTISALDLDVLKIHQMQIIRGTRLATEYASTPFRLYTPEEYIKLVSQYVELLRKDIIIERFVSQSPADLLVAPKWKLKNHEFTDKLVNYMKKTGCYQGKRASETNLL